MQRKLELAFTELIAGVFTVDGSALDGTDGLSDVEAFEGTFDDITADLMGPITVTAGTDSLAGTVQASSMTANVSRPDDPGFWNPNNPSSPLNGEVPGFVPIRPGRLTETADDGTMYGVFYGFLRRAQWQATSRTCQLYFEDLLFRASRVYPVIASTGPTTTGAAIGKVLDATGWVWSDFRSLAVGDALDDFSADGSLTALQIFANLVAAELGTVFVRGDGVFVFESRDMVQTRAASLTLSTSVGLEDLQSGIDADSLLTRVIVTKTDPTGDTDGITWTSIDDAAENLYGRSDIPALSSPYVPAAYGQTLADDLVYQGVNGKPPMTAYAVVTDDETLGEILSTPLQSVIALDDSLGGTEGDYVLQGVTHTIDTGSYHAQYTLTKRLAATFTVDGSALDGTDELRY